MQRHVFTFGGGLIAIFLTIAILESGASVIRGQQQAATPEFSLETPDLSDVPTIGEDGSETVPMGDTKPSEEGAAGSGNAVRDVAPEQFPLADEVESQPLERVEARKPLSEPQPEPQIAAAVLRRPVAVSAGLVAFEDGRTLQLEGLAPEKADRTCDDNGKSWPCGEVARTAFRNYLRARALVCEVPKNGWQGTTTAHCVVGNDDPALWLAQNGWAEATTAGSPLSDAVDEARRGRVGFYGSDPRRLETTPEMKSLEKTLDDAGTEGGAPDL